MLRPELAEVVRLQFQSLACATGLISYASVKLKSYAPVEWLKP
jgi:hypothetical protein